MTDFDASVVGEPPPPYMIFLLVFLFFLTGLLGFLICHLLKKKGYRCRTGDMDDEEGEEEEEEKQGGHEEDEEEENQDTVEQILKCIIENEANMEAFKEMLGNQNVCVHHDPRLLRKESLGGIPPHHHTVHSGSDHNACHLCAQGRSKKNRRRSRMPRAKQRLSEQTVFSVGRFRVTHTDKKPLGGPRPLVNSGDQLDQSQDSEDCKDGVVDRKEGGYNLRNMFKDVLPTPESSNEAPPNVGKRRKSVTIFGLRRGSDPAGMKLATGTGREAGALKLAIQQQPVVLEEPLKASDLADDTGVRPEARTKTETIFGSTRLPVPASLPCEAKTSDSAPNSPSSETHLQDHESSCIPEVVSTNVPVLEPRISHTTRSSDGNTPAPAPSLLPSPPPTLSGQTFKMIEREIERDEEEIKQKVCSPGPLQTFTPIAPGPGSIPGLASILYPPQPEPSSSAGLPMTQSPPGPSSASSSDPDPGFGASPVSISQGSSPLSPFPVNPPSLVSSMKTPNSPPVLTPSPKLHQSLRDTLSVAAKTASSSPSPLPSPELFSVPRIPSQSPIPPLTPGKSHSPLLAHTPSPSLSPSPKLTAMAISQQTPSSFLGSSPHLNVQSGSKTSVASVSLAKGDMVATPTHPMERELEGDMIPMTDEKMETESIGNLKIDKPSMGDTEGTLLSSPSDSLSKNRLSNLPLLPSSPLSTSSHPGSRISCVTIVKASPDSKREFSVVTMVEEEEHSTLTESQRGESPELGFGQMQVRVMGLGGEKEEASIAVVGLAVSQEKDDMVEMEDIRDCKVKQVEERQRVEEESEGMKTAHTQQKED